MNKYQEIKQLPLALELDPFLGKEDFMVSACNAEAYKMVESWPEWPFFAICLYGPEGCGKTHLAHIFADNVSVATHFPYKIPSIKAKDIRFETPPALFEKHNCLIVENLSAETDNEALFHLYNLYRNEGGFILFTSEQAPARINFALPDLRSRMNIVPAIEIKEPDDSLLSALIVKLFTDRQITTSEETLSYILQNMQRSYAYARKLVAEIDSISLARKRAVSVPLVKEAIATLNDTHQGELFNF